MKAITTIENWDRKKGSFFVGCVFFSVKRDLTSEEVSELERALEHKASYSPIVIGGFLLGKGVPFAVKRKYRSDLGVFAYYEAKLAANAIRKRIKMKSKQGKWITEG